MNIPEELKMIVKNKFDIDIQDVDSELLGDEINFKPVDLAIFLKLLEEKFLIEFNNEDIINGKFNTIANISCLLEKELQTFHR